MWEESKEEARDFFRKTARSGSRDVFSRGILTSPGKPRCIFFATVVPKAMVVTDAQRFLADLEEKRKAAVRALGSSQALSAEQDATIAERLEDEDWSVREAAVEALGSSPEALRKHGTAIAERLEDDDWRVR